MRVSILHLKCECGATPIVTSRGALEDGDFLTMPVVKERGARDPLSEITKIWVFKCAKSHSTTLKHVDGIQPKEPYPPCLRKADRALLAGYPRCLLWICELHWEVCCSFWQGSAIKSLWNSASVQQGWMVSCARLRYTQDYLTPGPWFNINMSAYQYKKSYCGDKTVVRSSYLHKGISYAGKMYSLYWIGSRAYVA